LAARPYLAEGSPSAGILLHAVGSRPAGSEVDVSLIYGDYYFLEALLRYRRGVV
jgi:unsaturated chondroitin disaccharide hydrolase